MAGLPGPGDGGPAPGVAPYYLPLWVRLPSAIAIIVVGALLGWRWTVVVGSMLALPEFFIISWSMLVGILPFVREAGGRWLDAPGRSLEWRPQGTVVTGQSGAAT